MKLKNFTSLLISGSMLLSGSVFAAEIFDYSIDQENKAISFTYIDTDFGKTECGISVTPSSDNIPVYANQKKSDFGGIIQDNITLSQTGWYTLSIKPMGKETAFTKQFALLSETELNNYWNTLTCETDFETIRNEWAEFSDVFAITISDNTQIYALCKVLSQNRGRDFGVRSEENLLAFKAYLASEAELLAQLNRCRSADIQDVCALLENSFPFIKSIDEVFFNEFAEMFKTMKSEIASAYAEEADGVYTFAGEYELLKKCVDTVKLSDIISKINKASHISNVSDIITVEENAKLLGIWDLIDEYLALETSSAVDRALWNKNFKNKDEFTKAFSSALSKAEDDNDKNSSGSSSSSGGFKSSSVTAPVVVAATESLPRSDSGKAVFDDISGYDWAKSAIISLFDKQIINGRGEGIFAPGDNVTRAEFVKMLLLSLGIEASDVQSVFSDVSSNDWFASFVCTANEHGIAMGNEGKFNPYDFITREDAAVMICRGLSLQGSGELTFTDKDYISDYAVNAISALVGGGIINGMSDGSFAPKSNLTRAEAAVMLDRLIQKYITEAN